MANRRVAPLAIVSPLHLRPRLNILLELDTYDLPYELSFHTVHPDGLLQLPDVGDLEIFAFPLQHRIETNGYLLREKAREPNIRKDMIERYDLPWQVIKAIKAGGGHIRPNGTVIPHEDLVSPAPPPRSYAHCSDTIYFPELANYVQGVDLLYHEATFLEDMAEDAAKKGHSTAKDAARTARDAGVSRLVMGHYSARYDHGSGHEAEARAIFPNSDAADDFWRFAVPYQGR